MTRPTPTDIVFLEKLQAADLSSKVTEILKEHIDSNEYAAVTNLSVAWRRGELCVAGMAIPGAGNKKVIKSLMSFVITGGELVDLGAKDLASRVENPRLLVHEDQLYVVSQIAHRKQYTVTITPLDDGLRETRPIVAMSHNRVEKNWGLFFDQGRLRALYSASPSRLLTAAEDGVMIFDEDTGTAIDERFGIGTLPVLYQDRYYFIIHRKDRALKGFKTYLMQLAMFDPYTGEVRVNHDVAYSHDLQSLMGVNRLGHNRVHSCTYAAGLLIEDNRIVVSYGVNDTGWGVAELPKSVLEPDNFSPMPEADLTPPKLPEKVDWRAVKRERQRKDNHTKLIQTVGPGEHFHRLITAKYNVPMCSRCREIMNFMNEIGVEACREQKSKIISDMWERRSMLKGWKSLATKLPGSSVMAKMELGKLFDESMRNAEQGIKDAKANNRSES